MTDAFGPHLGALRKNLSLIRVWTPAQHAALLGYSAGLVVRKQNIRNDMRLSHSLMLSRGRVSPDRKSVV